MAIERTLSIIKPDAVAKNVIGQIYARFERAGLKVVAARMAHLSRGEAEAFYAVHKARPFFNDLVKFMISGPVMIQVLEGESAIAKNRELMGATDPKKADKGTIRADFADSIDANAVHGSDAPETAAAEIAFFFPGDGCVLALNRRRWLGAIFSISITRDSRPFAKAWAKSAFARPSCCAGSTRRARAICDQMSDLAKSLRDKLADAADDHAAAGAVASMCRPTAPSSGCSTSAPAMRSKPCSSRKTIAARCASRRRPAARSVAVSARPASRASRRNLTHRRDRRAAVARRACAAQAPERRRRARHHQRRDDGHGRAAAELRGAGARAALMLDDHGYGLSRRRVTVSTSGVVPMIDRLRDDCPVALAVSLHAPTMRCATTWCRSTASTRSQSCWRPASAISTPRRATSSPSNTACSTASTTRSNMPDALIAPGAARARAVQVQPDPVQPVPRVGPDAFAARADHCVRARACRSRHRDHVRKTRGDDIDAACGQLAGEVQDRTRVHERLRRIPIVPAAARV